MTVTKRPLFDGPIVRRAVADAFRKLDPRHLVRNPVMFVVLVGQRAHDARARRATSRRGAATGASRSSSRSGSGSPCLRQLRRGDGRGARQGAGGQPARHAHADDGEAARRSGEARARPTPTPASELRRGDLVLCEPGDVIPGDGEVVEGVASVDESRDHRRIRAGHPRVAAAIARRSPAARRCSPTTSSFASPRIPARPSSTA